MFYNISLDRDRRGATAQRVNTKMIRFPLVAMYYFYYTPLERRSVVLRLQFDTQCFENRTESGKGSVLLLGFLLPSLMHDKALVVVY